jgi:hypothetical protein
MTVLPGWREPAELSRSRPRTLDWITIWVLERDRVLAHAPDLHRRQSRLSIVVKGKVLPGTTFAGR